MNIFELEQRMARDIVDAIDARLPKRKIVGNNLVVTERSQSVAIPLYRATIISTQRISSR
jgi:hypothetical protein